MIIKYATIIILSLVTILFLSSCAEQFFDNQPVSDTTLVSDSDSGNIISGSVINNTPIKKGCNCPEERVLVCGTNNKMYINSCQAECLGIDYVEGECNTRVDELQLFPCGETGGGLLTSTNSVCGKMVDDNGFVKWKTFPTSQTACGFRNKGIAVKEYTRGDCQ